MAGFRPLGHLGQPTAKFYERTRTGRKQLKAEADEWHRLTTAVALVLNMG